MAKPANVLFGERVAKALAEELDDPQDAWWYLSFADDTFLGGVIVKAKGFVHARMSLPLLGIASPGGEVMGVALPEEAVPSEKYRNRLLTREEIVEFWPDAKTLRELEEE